MPCNSDYQNPTRKEELLQKTAELLVFVRTSLGLPIGSNLKKNANDCYCSGDYVEELCSTLTNMSDSQKELIIYDSHNRKSRELATWWEEHQLADKKRLEVEAEAKRLKDIRTVALSKLTLAEKRALGLD